MVIGFCVCLNVFMKVCVVGMMCNVLVLKMLFGSIRLLKLLVLVWFSVRFILKVLFLLVWCRLVMLGFFGVMMLMLVLVFFSVCLGLVSLVCLNKLLMRMVMCKFCNGVMVNFLLGESERREW